VPAGDRIVAIPIVRIVKATATDAIVGEPWLLDPRWDFAGTPRVNRLRVELAPPRRTVSAKCSPGGDRTA
jgi:hypothetical protein